MNLGETETYEPGIYQLEITDPVIAGPDGIDNLQAKQLANRTNWLKAKIDSILGMSFIHTAVTENPGDTDEFGYWDSFTQTPRKVTLANFIVTIRTSLDAVYAVLNSPAFTGIPTAPTATAGTNTTQIATTAGVRAEIPNMLNATGSAPMYACRAWINFNGTGIVAIRASGNVSSITDNGVGNYTVNFTTAMPDANYSIAGIATSAGGGAGASISSFDGQVRTVSAVQVVADRYNLSVFDPIHVNVNIFR